MSDEMIIKREDPSQKDSFQSSSGELPKNH